MGVLVATASQLEVLESFDACYRQGGVDGLEAPIGGLSGVALRDLFKASVARHTSQGYVVPDGNEVAVYHGNEVAAYLEQTIVENLTVASKVSNYEQILDTEFSGCPDRLMRVLLRASIIRFNVFTVPGSAIN